MSLKDIKAQIVAETGYKLNNASELALFLARVNTAAREIFMMSDLDGSLDEDVFDFYTTTQQVVVPHFVGLVRGGRYYDNRAQCPVDWIGNRYSEDSFGNETWYLKFREIAKSPLQREIENASVIRFSVPIAETSDITISIQGQTDRSTTYKEAVTIVAGQLYVDTQENYLAVRSLVKNSLTRYDITATDVEGNILAVIPNDRKHHLYTIWQVSESEQPYSAATAVELLYKIPFFPLEDDGDQFLGTDKYDQAIVWKFLEHRAKKIDDIKMTQLRGNQAINIAHSDSEPAAKRMKIGFTRGPYQGLDYGNIGSSR